MISDVIVSLVCMTCGVLICGGDWSTRGIVLPITIPHRYTYLVLHLSNSLSMATFASGISIAFNTDIGLVHDVCMRFQLDFGPRCAPYELSPYSVQFEFFATQRLCSHDVALKMKKSILSFGFSTNLSHRVVSSLNRWGWQATWLCKPSLRLFWFPILILKAFMISS